MKAQFFAAIAGRLVACLIILAIGFLAMRQLVAMREPPVQAEVRERPVKVQVIEAIPANTRVNIVGLGRVRARDVVTIAPEIAGRVVQIHPRLEVGEILTQGEVLFAIDPRDYEARFQEATASVEVWESTIERLRRQYAIDQERLKTLLRSQELAVKEYERVKSLFETDQVGTQSGVDAAEQAANVATDQADLLQQQVALYPIRIREAESSLASASAMAGMAEANLGRAVVRAPFNARVKEVDLEAGQYVSPGMPVLTLADDSLLEIPVGLPSQQARQWLQFDGTSDAVLNSGKAWFGKLKPVPVEVAWTEAADPSRWTGHLTRIERFDPDTRTITVVVSISGDDANQGQQTGLPLVEGMFCRVTIPGKLAKNVIKVPAEAVSFPQPSTGKRSVFLARLTDSGVYRLQTHSVAESHLEGPYIYLTSEGITPGDLIVVTRLVNPLENTLLDIETVTLPEIGT